METDHNLVRQSIIKIQKTAEEKNTWQIINYSMKNEEVFSFYQDKLNSGMLQETMGLEESINETE